MYVKEKETFTKYSSIKGIANNTKICYNRCIVNAYHFNKGANDI